MACGPASSCSSGLGVMWSYDLFVDAHALLFRQLDPDLVAARGAIQALIVPLLAVAAARNPSWSLQIGISRGAVFPHRGADGQRSCSCS
ncbi:MAG: hypothetical protein WDO24_30440 [Pseudomonadota bacterium]